MNGGVTHGDESWPERVLHYCAFATLRRRRLSEGVAVFSPRFRSSALISALQALGWVEGRNIRIEFFDSPSDIDARRAIAHAILARSPDIIFANSSAALSALQPETTAVPIVFVGVADPVSQGFVESFAKPGGHYGFHSL
jgi:hypothetical protein